MAEGQHTNGAATAAEATPTAAPASAPPATQAAASQPAAPTPLPSMSTAPRPAAQQAAAPLPSAHAGSEKSLFPNSLPVRQSLPSIHSFGASHSPINAGPYGDSRARSAGTESKGATPNRFSASPSPYNPLPSLSNTGSPKLAAPTSATSQGAPHSSASPRLPGLTKLSPPAPAAATPPATTASPASYRNPMSVSSMLSGPSRDRPYGSVNSTGAASGAGASPQPPVLPPAPSAHGGARKEESKHENGKATSPPVNPAMGGFRRPAEGSSASPAAKAGGQGRSTGGEKGSMSPAGGAGAAGGDKDAGASNSTANKTERSYPPLPSAFARESPYSTWASSSKKDQGFGARHDSASSKEASPPAPQGGAPKQAGKTFFPSNNSFSRPPPTTSTHRHSHSAGGPSFPPTFPWTAATLQQQQQQQQAQQQQAQQPQQQQQQQGASSTRSYPDFYHTNSADSLRAQEEKRKAEAASASHHPHSSQASAQQQQHRQGASQPHQSGKSHVRYPGSDAYSLGGRPGPTAPTAHVSATQDMPSWRTAESGATSTIPAPLNSSTSAHKRRRSEGVQSALRQEGGFADGKPKVVKTPFVPPFSLADQRKATVRPPLLNVRNDEVLKALALPSSPSAEADTKAPKRPFLGRVVYDPFVNPATLLDGQLLRSNVGGVVEVAISTGWFESSPFLSSGSSSSDPSPSLPSTLYEFGDPATYDGSPLSDVTADETDPRIPPSVWELEGIRKRKVWGSDVYTDDSDVLALLLHSGWLRLGRRKEGGQKLVAGEKGAGEQAVKASRIPWKGFAGEGEGEKKREGVKSLVVKLIVAPRLVRYQGCERMGLKSRSWGNGHDGVSLMVEGVDLADELLRPHGRRWTKRRLGDFVESLLPKDVAAPPSAIDVTLPRDGSSTPDDQEKLSVVDTFVLGPRNEDCSFVRTELSPVLANGAAAAAEGEAMELDVV